MNHLPTLPHGYAAQTAVYRSRWWTAVMHHYGGKVGPVLHVTDITRIGINEVYLANQTAIEMGASFLGGGDNQPELIELFDELNEELNYD